MDEFYRNPSINGLSALYAQHKPAGLAAPVADIDDPLLTHPSALKHVPPITDPADRAKFKATLPGIRKFAASETVVSLPDVFTADSQQYLAQRSYRQFADTPLALTNLAELLSNLRARELNDKPKYLYGSAGGLYPIQTYVYIKPGRVAGLDAGIYYFEPLQNQLLLLNADPGNVRELYDPIINRPVFDAAAFAIYFVVEMQAIGSMYSERSLHYSVIEAGSMTQLLESAAPGMQIGLCQIGGLETKYFTDLLKLGKTHILLHALVGGGIDAAKEQAALNPVVSNNDASDNRDEGEI
jgi:SagB-type dehydrogenase family enzyme